MSVARTLKALPLGDLFWFQEGPGVRNWQFKDSGVKLLNVANIEKSGGLNLDKTNRYLSVEEVKTRYSHFLVDAGDLVIASSGISFDADGMLRTRGAFVDESHLPLCLNTSTIRFKAKEGISDLGYLKHWLDSLEFREKITKRVTGSAQQNFGPSHLKAIQIALPSLSEQRRIAAILDQADALRAKRREALAQLDSLTESIFADRFGNSENGYFGVKIVQLDEVTTRITDGTHLTPKFVNAGVPFIFVRNFGNGRIDFETDKFISEEEHATLYKRCPVEAGDVLYTTVGATYGQAATVGSFTKFAFQRHVAHLKPDTKKIHPEFLGKVMQLPFVKKQADRWARGAAQPTVNLTELRQFEIPLPTFEKQLEFVKKAVLIDELKRLQGVSLDQIASLFSSLQHRAFSGTL